MGILLVLALVFSVVAGWFLWDSHVNPPFGKALEQQIKNPLPTYLHFNVQELRDLLGRQNTLETECMLMLVLQSKLNTSETSKEYYALHNSINSARFKKVRGAVGTKFCVWMAADKERALAEAWEAQARERAADVWTAERFNKA